MSAEKVLQLLQASSCFRGDVCAMLPCACAETIAARIEALEAALIDAAVHLAAAISLLERTPKAKQAAPSDKMFEIMLSDYKKSLKTARAALKDKDAGL
jgi:hypothetical protein